MPAAAIELRMTPRMQSIDAQQDTRVDRRTAIKRGLIAGGLIAGAGSAIGFMADALDKDPAAHSATTASPSTARPRARHAQPNILIIMVDQFRYPQWFSPDPAGLELPPNLRRLRQEGISFARHYTVANDCTPSRSALLT